MDLSEKVIRFCKEEKIHLLEKRILVAVSGGKDSMALLHLLVAMKAKIGVAHCNFKLRGADADEDAAFVEKTANTLGVPFYSISFDTKAEMEDRKMGVQEAARVLRYEWLEKIRAEEKYYYIATAHHADDQVETMLANFVRGTGIKGLRGMLPNRNNIIRPLLQIKSDIISAYLTDSNIAYRTDSSNAKTDYTRNKLRLEVIPMLEKINPAFVDTLLSQQQLYRWLETSHNVLLEKKIAKIFIEKSDSTDISIGLLKKTPHAAYLLYDYLHPLGFNMEQCAAMIESVNSVSGKQFLSTTHRIVKDRNTFILSKISDTLFAPTLLRLKETGQIKIGNKLLKWHECASADIVLSDKQNVAYIDKDKLSDELLLRQWLVGDYFYPLGMGMKKKKVSKFFKDIKLSIKDKENVLILADGDKILWLVNHRMDERYKITDSTKRAICFEWTV